MPNDRSAHRLAVLGAGVMGTSITAMAIGHGVPVLLIDVVSGALERAQQAIAQQLRHAKLMGALPEDRVAGELTTSTSVQDATDATAVIEAVTEDTESKAKVLAEVSSIVAAGTPVISNTSGIPIDEMSAWVERADELVGAHFMNPSYLISTVEVVSGPRTSEQTLDSVVCLLEALNRRPVVIQDGPGFVTSRLLHPMINEASRIVGAGIASAEAVDELMQSCLGHPTGPLRTADLIGLDNLVDSLRVLHERTGDERCRPSEVLLDKVRTGELGRKTGQGFYDYGKALS